MQSTREPSRRSSERGRFVRLVAVVLALQLVGCDETFADAKGLIRRLLNPWPQTSSHPVEPLTHPTIEERIRTTGHDPAMGFRFINYGDQRALAGGEWEDMIRVIADRFIEDRLLLVVDSGDVIDNGVHADQWEMLHDILSPIREIPYWVAVGNHELEHNRSKEAREYTAQALRPLAPDFTVGHMYYRKDVGPATFLVLDSNAWIYGPEGERYNDAQAPPGSLEAKQLSWLIEELGRMPSQRLVIVVVHQPFVASSSKHREGTRSFWNFSYQGRNFPRILYDGGVDLVLVGHTHTYEHYVLRRNEGRRMHVVNLSGRPKTYFGLGGGERRANDIRGVELEYFGEKGWKFLDGWSITQLDAMLDEERDQFGVFDVSPDGGLRMQIHYVDGDDVTTSPVRTLD